MSHRTAVAGLALGALAAACSQNVVRTMFPTPIVMQDERLDFSRTALPEDRGTEVSVLFATTRAPAPLEAPERYATAAGDAVRDGTQPRSCQSLFVECMCAGNLSFTGRP